MTAESLARYGLRAAAGLFLCLSAVLACGSDAAAQTTVTFTVSDNSDDADQYSGNGHMWVGDRYSLLSNYCGARFRNVTIPAGATITSATLELHSYGSGTTSFSVDLHAEDADNPSTFSTSSYNLSNRPRTSAKTSWVTGSTSYSWGQAFTSPNFASSIQEVIDRPGWSSGNSLVVITVPVSGAKGFWKRSGNSSYAPQLSVTYTTASVANGKTLLMITASSSPNSEESSRISQFESWGYTVTTIEDSATGSSFASALNSSDVVYVPQSTDAASLAYKLRTTTVGVVQEGVTSWGDEMGWTTSTGQNTNTCSTMTVVDNTHDITNHFSTGTQTIFSSSSAAYGQQVIATVASGADILATNRCVNSGNANLLALDRDAALANTYDSNSTASGRRVHLPFGGSYTFSWSNVSADGLKMVQNALAWAAEDALIGHWKLDETSGTVATDSSDYGHNGTYTNGASPGAAGIRGYAGDFDGTNDHVAINGGSDHNTRENFTIACWAKSDTSTFDGHGSLVSKRHAWVLHPNNGSTTVYLHVANSAGNQYSGTFDMADVGGIQGWHHYVGVYDGSAGQIKLYVDGVLRQSSTFTPGSLVNSNTSQMTIGKDSSYSSSDRHFDGQIDDVRLYGRALSDTEVAKLYGLVGHWKLDETSGTVAADSSGIGADGEYVDSPTLGTGALRGFAATFDSDSSGQHVNVPSSVLDGVNTVGLSWWMKTSNTGQQAILSCANSTIANELLVFFESATRFRPIVENSAPAYTIDSIADGRWHHYVYLLDRPTGVEKLYKDSELIVDGTRTGSNNTIDIDSGGLILAQEQDSVGGGFSTGQDLEGDLDDVRIYDRMLTDAEIAELYGLIGHWRLDEISGTVAADSSPFGHDGTIYGAPLQGESAVRGTGYDFATGDEIEVAETDALNSACTADNQAFAVAFWVKPDTETSTWHSIFQKGTSNVPRGPGVWIDNDGTDLHMAMATTTSSNWGDDNGQDLPLDEWTHVVVQATGGQLEWYINGSLQRTRTIGGTIVGAEGPIHIGQTYAYQPPGRLDDIRFYNRALDEAEIAEIYGLVGWWRMEEASGTTVSDSSGRGNDGTIAGTASWTSSSTEGYGALELDGADYVEVPSLVVTDATDGVSVAGWAKLTTADTEGAELITLGDAFGIRIDEPGTPPAVRGWGYNGSSWQGTTFEGETAGSGWKHFALSYRATDHSLELYVDGVLESSYTMSSPPSLTGLGSTLRIGTHGNGETTRNFTGSVDDVRVYNRTLQSEEARQLFYGGWNPGPRIIKWVEVANP